MFSHAGLTLWCARSFIRDADDKAPLKDHGFMIEWAQRAGKLVFQEAEDLDEQNIPTFCNLCLFWHSQGSWRIAYLHKGSSGISGVGRKYSSLASQ